MDNSENKIPYLYRDCFDKSPIGQAVLDHLYQMFYDIDTFDTDPYKHAFKAGQRSVVRFIMLQRDALAREQQGEQE